MPKQLILLTVVIFLAACAEKNKSDETSKEIATFNNISTKIQSSPREITYLRMKADFSRRVDKGFTIVTLDLKTGAEQEYNNKNYKNVEILGAPNPHPSGEKVIAGYQKYNGAPHTIIEIELDSGEISEVPNCTRIITPEIFP